MDAESFLRELNVPVPQPTVKHEDNRGSITVSSNGLGGPRSRHLDIKHHYVVEQVRERRVAVPYIPSSDNLADAFTKSLPTPQFRALVDQFTVRLDDYLKDDEDSIPPTGPMAAPYPPVKKKKSVKKKKPTALKGDSEQLIWGYKRYESDFDYTFDPAAERG
eukprot:g16897.t1